MSKSETQRAIDVLKDLVDGRLIAITPELVNDLIKPLQDGCDAMESDEIVWEPGFYLVCNGDDEAMVEVDEHGAAYVLDAVGAANMSNYDYVSRINKEENT